MMKSSLLNIEQYLNHKGCPVKVAYFEKSALQIGHEFQIYGYRVVYRVEYGEFIICYLEAINKRAFPNGFFKLFNLLHHLGKDINELSIVRMMIVDNISSPTLQSIRYRLIKLLIAKGAFSKNINGDDWLLFDVS